MAHELPGGIKVKHEHVWPELTMMLSRIHQRTTRSGHSFDCGVLCSESIVLTPQRIRSS
jgi:hypothetical protein